MNPWGDGVITGDYAGHPGLLYRQRPRTYAELLTGVERWTPRTFLVGGGSASVSSSRRYAPPVTGWSHSGSGLVTE